MNNSLQAQHRYLSSRARILQFLSFSAGRLGYTTYSPHTSLNKQKKDQHYNRLSRCWVGITASSCIVHIIAMIFRAAPQGTNHDGSMEETAKTGGGQAMPQSSIGRGQNLNPRQPHSTEGAISPTLKHWLPPGPLILGLCLVSPIW